MKKNGKIVKYFKEKGYGFILDENKNNVFFHVSNIINPVDDINFSKVKFNIISTAKGYEALEIELCNTIIPSFITLGSNRIKLSNIKNYGLTQNTYTKKIPIEKTKLEKGLDSIGIVTGLVSSLLNVNIYTGVTEQKFDTHDINKDVLYITTYQNENFRFEDGSCDFNIYEKLKELDSYMTY